VDKISWKGVIRGYPRECSIIGSEMGTLGDQGKADCENCDSWLFNW
jgi:hypothetical protein